MIDPQPTEPRPWLPELHASTTLPGIGLRHVVLIPSVAVLVGKPASVTAVLELRAGTTWPDEETKKYVRALITAGTAIMLAFIDLEDATACLARARRQLSGQPVFEE